MRKKNFTKTVNNSTTFLFPPLNKCMLYQNLKALTSCNQSPPTTSPPPKKTKKKQPFVMPQNYTAGSIFVRYELFEKQQFGRGSLNDFCLPLRAGIWDNGTAKQQRPDCAIHYNNTNKNPQKPTIGFYCWPLGFTDCRWGGGGGAEESWVFAIKVKSQTERKLLHGYRSLSLCFIRLTNSSGGRESCERVRKLQSWEAAAFIY